MRAGAAEDPALSGPDNAAERPGAMRTAFAAAIAFSILSNLMMLTSPLYMLLVYDRVLASGSVETLAVLLGTAAVVFALTAVLDDARARIFLRLALAGGTGQDGPAAGDDRRALASPGFVAALDLPFVPLFLAVLWALHPLVGAVGTAGVAALGLMSLGHARRQAAAAARLQAAQAAVALARGEGLVASILTDDAAAPAPAGARGAGADDDGPQAGEILAARLALADDAARQAARGRAIRQGAQAAITAAAALAVIRADISVGAMAAAAVIAGRTFGPIEQAPLLAAGMRAALRALAGPRQDRGADGGTGATPPAAGEVGAAGAGRAAAGAAAGATAAGAAATAAAAAGAAPAAAAATAATAAAAAGAAAGAAPAGAAGGGPEIPPGLRGLTVTGLTVAAPGARAACLREVAFRAAPGEVLGLCGPTGAGKSALLRTLAGGWRPAAGSVLLDGLPPGAGSTGYLPQRWHPPPATAAAVIGGGRPLGAAIAAADLALAHEAIAALPEGYATVLAGRGGAAGPGAPLSFGEIRRIGIARAFCGWPALVILDDPENGLDEAGMRGLHACLDRLRAAGGTAVIASGRAATLARCDRVLALLARYGIRSTFFVPGLIIEQRPQLMERILKGGHEIAHHSY
ncbi:MAG: ATP-binding cassette domain-containing protein, partial [Rhodobacteraceae bacterium]|nr:ATP-binding cassette domain-containing protein [Paracoccaceae bacterium]